MTVVILLQGGLFEFTHVLGHTNVFYFVHGVAALYSTCVNQGFIQPFVSGGV